MKVKHFDIYHYRICLQIHNFKKKIYKYEYYLSIIYAYIIYK